MLVKRSLFGLLLLGLCSFLTCKLSAQVNSRPSFQPRPQAGTLAQTAPGGEAQAISIAIPGSPFGVFVVDLPLRPGAENEIPRVIVSELNGRVFYPAVDLQSKEVVKGPLGNAPAQPLPRRQGGRVRRRPGGFLDRLGNAIRNNAPRENVPQSIRVAGLFRGDGPLTVKLGGEISQTLNLIPSSDLTGHRQHLEMWWEAYTNAAKRDISGLDAPKLISRYLCATLARRLDLPYVDLDPPTKKDEKEDKSKPLETLALLGGVESMRDEILEDVLANPGDANASLPPPPAPSWAPVPQLAIDPNVEIETLATRVPPECFYLRFGAFSNFVWFQEIAERYGGDIAQSVLVRGYNYDAKNRLERMLASKMTSLAKMFGDSLIGDLAVVGTDLYMTEGASLGVIFEARNPSLLIAGIEADRKAAADKRADASVQKLNIQGKEVVLLSTPDNQLRSFFVADGNYVFVTTSRRLAERFIEVGNGAPSLAEMSNFRSIRSWMPDRNNYSVFAYFSPEFFQHLVSPQYQIELRRRFEAIAHLEAAELAQLVAQSEGIPAADSKGLKLAGLLPPWFDERADGAQILQYQNQLIDSTRGARGSFVPINDLPLVGVNAREDKLYRETAEYYESNWQNMDPIVVGLRRFQGEGNSETVALEAYMAPFGADKYGWIGRQLGAPTYSAISLPSDDLANLQLHVRESPLLQTSGYHLFAGMKDMYPPDDAKGLLQILTALQSTKAYIGAWPKPGYVEKIPLGILQSLSQPDVMGFSRMVGGLWRWQGSGFSLLSFSKPILDAAIPQLATVRVDDPAQARLVVQNLQGTELSRWINDLWYRRGWDASNGNARLLDTVGQQFKVPPTDCIECAEQVLDLKLQCPLGGRFEYKPVATGEGGWWTSSAWDARRTNQVGNSVAPDDYKAPWVDWFRGGRMHATQLPNSMALVGTVDLEMQPLPVDLSDSLPTNLPSMNFDIFSLPGKLFGTSEKQPETRRKF